MTLVTKDPAPKKHRAVTIFDHTIDYAAVLSGGLIIFIMLLIVTEVFMRYFLNRPITGGLEITEISLVYITFLGAAWVLKKEGHVKVDLLLDRLKPRHQHLVNFATSLAGVIICFMLTWYGVSIAWEQHQQGIFLTATIRVPTAPVLAIIPIGMFLFGLQFLRRAYGYLKSWRAA